METAAPSDQPPPRSLQVAVYGKGGIGKSTISANLSAAIGRHGHSVLQIGCDPKHDSTRLLTGGRKMPTVLEFLRVVPAADQRLDGIVSRGFADVDCIEAGGPEPGVGCAGRGILSTFSLLDRLEIRRDAYGMVLFDVLGDVVCGGFAVPLRKDYADTVVLVTSEEFMPIYAANNILRGIKNFDHKGLGIAGLIVNLRERRPDLAAVRRFADEVRLPILATLPRSDVIGRAEQLGKTVIEAFPESREARAFEHLARHLLNGIERHPALPLDEEALEEIVLSRKPPRRADDRALPEQAIGQPEQQREAAAPASRPAGEARPRRVRAQMPPPTPYYYRKPPVRPPVQGCAYTGAITLLDQIKDAVVVSHGPRSCAHMDAHYLFSAGRRRAIRHGLALSPAPALVSTDMDEDAMVYGGGALLRDALRRALASEPAAVFVVTSCPSGLIGDDIDAAIREVRPLSPELPIIALDVGGNLSGGYIEGWLDAYLKGAAALIDDSCEPAGKAVNLVCEASYGSVEQNFAQVRALLAALGVQVNTRFVQHTTVQSLRGFRKARLNLLAYEGLATAQVTAFLRERFGAVFARQTFPIGFHQTRRWLEEIAEHFGCEAAAGKLVADLRREYESGLQEVRRHLRGRRIMLLVTYAADIDWMIETAFDCGMEVVKLAVLQLAKDTAFSSRHADRVPVQFGYLPEQRASDFETLRPDLVITGFIWQDLPAVAHYDTFPSHPQVGPQANLALARRWCRLLRTPLAETWKSDARLAV